MPTDKLNRGVLPPVVKESDYVAGKESGLVAIEVNPEANWENDLPSNESQFVADRFETGGCTNFSQTNSYETQINFMKRMGTLPEKIAKKLEEWGYFDSNGKVNFSDRHLYKVAGTTIQGNHVQVGIDAARHFGLVPEKMWGVTQTYEEWIKSIPSEIQEFAKNFLTLFEIKYEWIVMGNCGKPDLEFIKAQLKQAPLLAIHPACPHKDGVFQSCGSCASQHATLLYKVDDFVRIYDSYNPYQKPFAKDYPLTWLMKAVVRVKSLPPVPVIEPFNHVFNVDMRKGDRNEEVRWLQKALNRLGYKVPETGYYGNITTSLVKSFQWKYKVALTEILIKNGGKYVGPATRKALNNALKVV